MAVRRFEKDEKSDNGVCRDIKGEGHGLASALDSASIVGNTCNKNAGTHHVMKKTHSCFRFLQ
jgi:hypothetical protein